MYLASPAHFAGANDIITNLQKRESLESGSSKALPNLGLFVTGIQCTCTKYVVYQLE